MACCGRGTSKAVSNVRAQQTPQHLVTPKTISVDPHPVGVMAGQLSIKSVDAPKSSKAPSIYKISPAVSKHSSTVQVIKFQDGPITQDGKGINGITAEALLAILIHRLECFQDSEYACPENQFALDHLIQGLDSLHRRTSRRVAAGVGGTHQVDSEAEGLSSNMKEDELSEKEDIEKATAEDIKLR